MSDNELEEAKARATAKALRGNVSGDFVPNPDSVNRAPTPMGVLGPRAAADTTKRRKQIDDAEDAALS